MYKRLFLPEKMAYTAFRGMKPLHQFLLLLFLMVVGFFVVMVISVILAIPFFGTNLLFQLTTGYDFNNPEMVNLLKYFQVSQSIGIFIVPSLIAAYLFSENLSQFLFLNKGLKIEVVLLVVILMIVASPFINLTGEINSRLVLPDWLSELEKWMKDTEEKAAEVTEAFLNVKTGWGLAFNLFMVGLLPAIGEELLFRGLIQRFFSKMTRTFHWGIWISAFLFSALHLQFYGFVPRMLLGVMFGYLLIWSGTLWVPVLAHFINNGFAVIAMFLIKKGLVSSDLEKIGSTQNSYYLAVISFFLIALIVWLIKRQHENQSLKIDDLVE